MSIQVPQLIDVADAEFHSFQRVYGIPMAAQESECTYVTNAVKETLRNVCERDCSPNTSSVAGRVITIGLSYLSLTVKRQHLGSYLVGLYTSLDFSLPFDFMQEVPPDILRFYIADGMLHHRVLFQGVPDVILFFRSMYHYLMEQIDSGTVYAIRSCSLVKLFCKKGHRVFLTHQDIRELKEFAFHNLDNSYLINSDTRYIFDHLRNGRVFQMTGYGITSLPWKDRLKYILCLHYVPPVYIADVLSRHDVVRLLLSDPYLCPALTKMYKLALKDSDLSSAGFDVLCEILRKSEPSILQENLIEYVLPTIWNLSPNLGAGLLQQLLQESAIPVSSCISVSFSCMLAETKFVPQYESPILDGLNSNHMLTRAKSFYLYINNYSTNRLSYFKCLRKFLIMNAYDNNSLASTAIISAAIGNVTKNFVELLSNGFNYHDLGECKCSLRRWPKHLRSSPLVANEYRKFFIWLYEMLYECIINSSHHCAEMSFRISKTVFYVFNKAHAVRQELAVEVLRRLCLSERALCCLLGALLSREREIREDAVVFFETYPQLRGCYDMNSLINRAFRMLTSLPCSQADAGVSLLQAMSCSNNNFCEKCMFDDLMHLLNVKWRSATYNEDMVILIKNNSLHSILTAINEVCPNMKEYIDVSLIKDIVTRVTCLLSMIVAPYGDDGHPDEYVAKVQTLDDLQHDDFTAAVNSMQLLLKACCITLLDVYKVTTDLEVLRITIQSLLTVLENSSHKDLMETAGNCFGRLLQFTTIKCQQTAFDVLAQSLNDVLAHVSSLRLVSTFERSTKVRVMLCAFTANDITFKKIFINCVLRSLLVMLEKTSRTSLPNAHASLLYYLDRVLNRYTYSFVFLQPYIVLIVELAIEAFAENDFSLRNAALQLFATVTKLILGEKRKPVNKETTRSISIEEFNYRLSRGDETSTRVVLVLRFFDWLSSGSVEQIIPVFSFLSQTFSRGPRLHRFPGAIDADWKLSTAAFREMAKRFSHSNTLVADSAIRAYVALCPSPVDVIEHKIFRQANKLIKYYMQNDLERFKRSLQLLKSYMDKDELGTCKSCLERFTTASYSNVAFEYILYDELDMIVESQHFDLESIRSLNSLGTRLNFKKRSWILANIKICLEKYKNRPFVYVLKESLKVKDYYLTNVCFAAVKARISEERMQRSLNKKLIFDIIFDAAIENENFDVEIFETVLMFLDTDVYNFLMTKAVLRTVYHNLQLPIKHVNRSAFLYKIALKGTLMYVPGDSSCLKKIINDAMQLCLNNLNKPLCDRLGLFIIEEYMKFSDETRTEFEGIATYLAIILFSTLLSDDKRIASEALAVFVRIYRIKDHLTGHLAASYLVLPNRLSQWLKEENVTQFLIYLHLVSMYKDVSTRNSFVETTDKVVEHCNTLRAQIVTNLKFVIDNVADVATVYKIVNWVMKNLESNRLDHVFERLEATKGKLSFFFSRR